MDGTAQETSDRRAGRVVTFYSYKGGTGRTMTLANTAWILAANGKRVLAVDWDLEAPGLSRFFHPFLDQRGLATTGGVVNMINNYLERAIDSGPTPEHAQESGYAAVSSHATSLDWPFPGRGGIDFISAGKQNEDYSTILNGLNWDQFYQDYEGGTFLDALREEMGRTYDYTLIDSRTGLSDSSKICTQQLPDDLVVCFTLSDQSIDGAAGVARLIDSRFGDRNIRILPVPMRVDENEKDRADRGRAVARQRFRGFPKELHTFSSTMQYWGSVEIPYRAFYAYEEVLATFGDEPGVPSTVLGACERLVGELTRGEVSGLPEMSADLRESTVARFVRKAVNGQANAAFQLWYAAEDQMWADWVAFVLGRAGYPVTASRIDAEPEGPVDPQAQGEGEADQELVSMPLLTRHFERTARAGEVWGPLAAGHLAGPRARTVGLRLGAVQPGVPAGHTAPLDLSSPSLNAVLAAEQLLHHVGADDASVRQVRAAVEAVDAPRYPGQRAVIVNLQSRNADFTGRAGELDRLRGRLTARGGSARDGAQALHGLGGVGKSQLALEYAYRYLPDYDLVWWIPSELPGSVTTGLAELATVLELRVGSLSDADAATAVLNALSEGRPYPKWLLIFDNAEDPASLGGFLPGGQGHVLITSRNQVWDQYAAEMEVDVFTPEESVVHLRRRVVDMDPDQARRLAEALGDLPLAVEQAAAYLLITGMSVDTYLDLLDTYPSDMFGDTTSMDYPLPIMTTFALSLKKLETEWPAAKRLLQMSVFLGPEAFSQTLVYKSPEMVRALSAHDVGSRSPVQLGTVVRAVRRLSLAKVDRQQGTIQVHRLLQVLLRLQMTEDEQARVRGEVQEILAGQRPLGGEVEDPENRPAFEQIRPHLSACSAESSDNPAVRQLMIDLVRLHWRSGDFTLAGAEADRIDALWSSTLGEEHEQTLALRCLRANILRDRGEYRQSLELDRRTWQSQCELFGEEEPGTLATARGMAAGMRALGMYREALDRDLKTYESLLQLFLEEDDKVLSLSHNIAIDHRLLGDSRSAQQFDERTERLRRQTLGPLHDRTLSSQLYLARDKRDGGQLREAAGDLERLLGTCRATKGDSHPETLRTAKSLAVSHRVLGAYEQAAELTRDTYARYVERYGEDHPDTWTCGLNLAADDWCAGRHEQALRRAEEVWGHLIRELGARHPDALASGDNVSVYLRAPGASPQRLRRSAALGEEITLNLGFHLGEEHPFTLCAEVNWANARAELGDLAAAERSERSCLARMVRTLGEVHPDTLACRSNLAVTLRALGQTDEAQLLHDAALRHLDGNRNFGSSHPETVRVGRWERISHVLELHSW
ncbi:FxSxx-COOH system tetratricopeptide repeat protein [Streptacidiphilus sp. PAMC 29251]